MRGLAAIVCAAACLGAVAQRAAVQLCTGLLSEDGSACCPESCGACASSATECSALLLDASSECCVDADSLPACSADGKAPCSMQLIGEVAEQLQPEEGDDADLTEEQRELRKRRRRKHGRKKRGGKKGKGGKGKGGGKKPKPKPPVKPQGGGAGDPFCLNGMLDDDVQYCCPSNCSRCSNSKTCTNFSPAEEPTCCGAMIADSGRPCGLFPAPCYLDQTKFQNAPGSSKRTANVGAWFAGGPDALPQQEQNLGVKFDTVMMYLPVGPDLKWSAVSDILDTKRQVQLVMEFYDSYPNLRDVKSGKYDQYLKDFGKDAKADGRQLTIRPLHELNGDWYNWDALRNGNNAEDFPGAFQHVVTTLRSTGGNFKFQISYAAKNSAESNMPFKDFYPGDSYVDQICVSAYNTCGTGTYKSNKSFSEIINTWYFQVTAFAPSKSLCIAEMSTTDQCGSDKAQWITDAWHSLADDYPKFTSVNWFFESKKLGSAYKDWALKGSSEENAFTQGFKYFKAATGNRRLADTL
eukprot:TRINITY_DN11043_c0_g1_i1.p1 TRINITY_DN11043_c0_g1~~TRINITY_DN11043_c0_g1_i1.p1  ORF type:complete len:522 (+),score=152.62 TRINITY_DN11043_c0_g1_i1:152-1717(+)